MSLAARRGTGVAAQLGLARMESPSRASRHLQLARVLTTELPHAFAAMRAGRLSEWGAMLLARETACLKREDRLEIDAALCSDQEGSRRPQRARACGQGST